MSIKAFAAKIFANIVEKQVQKWANNPIKTQDQVFQNLILKAKNTDFGKDHNLSLIHI